MTRLFAIAAMVLDHIGIFFFPEVLFFRAIGRLAFPLFAWGISKGYTRTQNYKSYFIRVFILAVVSQLSYSLLFCDGTLNVCFTLTAGLVLLKLYDSHLTLWFKIPLFLITLATVEFLDFEYGIYGALSVLLFYLFKHQKLSIYYYGGLTLAFTLIYRYHPMQLIAAFSPLLALGMEEFDHKINRLVSYSFYPLHLLLIYFVQGGFSL